MAPEIYTDKTDIKVSICTITYNHEKYIRQTLQSVLAQKTNFNFELLIHDDASTDNTAKIILEYQKKYPHIIKPVLQRENLMSKGVCVDQVYNWPRIKGQYVAYLDGDDYWTDAYKLQKQVDFLDAHADYSLVFHPAQCVWEDNQHKPTLWGPEKEELANLDAVIWKRNFIPTLSVMYRWRLHGANAALWPMGIAPGDWYVHLLHAQVGKVGFIPQVMGVYRKHVGGVWYNENQSDQFFLTYFWPRILFCQKAKAQFNKDFTFVEIKLLFELFNFCIKKGDYSLIGKLKEQNKAQWESLVREIQTYLAAYPARNLFLLKLGYKCSFGKTRQQLKERYLLDVAKETVKKSLHALR